MFIVFSIITNLMFYMDNKEFFDEVNRQMVNNPDLEWSYVDKQKPNPNAKALTLEDDNGEPYILFRLEEK
jgi:hypothetical protein|tara:strand:+ start:599 stop:808 length:210 start_codon:yes stop_codon:yes gene_type:complete